MLCIVDWIVDSGTLFLLVPPWRYDDPQSLDGQECPWKFSSASLHPSHCPTVACGHCFASRKWKVAEDLGNSWDGGNAIRVAF
jgi:hypothetical protein